MIDDLIAHGADLILHGHDHNFQRSHQLRCVDVNTTTSSCIADTDSDPGTGSYPGSVLSFDLTVGAYVGSSGIAPLNVDLL